MGGVTEFVELVVPTVPPLGLGAVQNGRSVPPVGAVPGSSMSKVASEIPDAIKRLVTFVFKKS